MKNYFIAILIVILAIGGVIFSGNKFIKNKANKPIQSQTTTQTSTPAGQEEKTQEASKIDYTQIFSGEIAVCQLFPKEKIEELTGKQFVNIRPGLNKTQKYTEYYCEYRQEQLPYSVEHGTPPQSPKNIQISFIAGNLEGLKDIYKLSKEEVKQDNSLPFSHHLVYNENGRFLRLEIFLADNLEVIINTWWSTLTQDESLKFVKDFTFYLKEFIQNKNQERTQNISSEKNNTATIHLPQDEEIIRNFFSFFGTDDAEKAALMMKTDNDSERQAWAVQFAAFNDLQILKIEKANEEAWTDNRHIYKVTLEVRMKQESVKAPIPYYGWQNGENSRWLTLEKVGDIWKIAEIATGF